jgi:hypothetical protein
MMDRGIDRIKATYRDNVMFMYHPFDIIVLTQVLANLRSSLLQSPRKIWLIYHNPVDDEVLGSSKLFSASRELAIELCLEVRAERGLPLTIETRQIEVTV